MQMFIQNVIHVKFSQWEGFPKTPERSTSLQTKTTFIEVSDAATHGEITIKFKAHVFCNHKQTVQKDYQKNVTPQQYTDDKSCVGSGWIPPLLSVGMQLCAGETDVIQAVSGSCDLEHPAQQLETTYITQLLD